MSFRSMFRRKTQDALRARLNLERETKIQEGIVSGEFVRIEKLLEDHYRKMVNIYDTNLQTSAELVDAYGVGEFETKRDFTNRINSLIWLNRKKYNEVRRFVNNIRLSIIALDGRVEQYSNMPYARSSGSFASRLRSLWSDRSTLSTLNYQRYRSSKYKLLATRNLQITPDFTIDDDDIEKRIVYPAVHIFPKNPALNHWISPTYTTERYREAADTVEARAGQIISKKKNSLEFDTGPNGTRNIIRTTSPIYLDYTQYNFKNNTWDERPIIFKIDGKDITRDEEDNYIEGKDLTNYFKKEIIGFPNVATGINDDISFYFDGEKLITNYDFSNPDDRQRVTIDYYKLTDSLRVKATLLSNTPNNVFRTPVIDQYTLVVGKQKVLN